MVDSAIPTLCRKCGLPVGSSFLWTTDDKAYHHGCYSQASGHEAELASLREQLEKVERENAALRHDVESAGSLRSRLDAMRIGKNEQRARATTAESALSAANERIRELEADAKAKDDEIARQVRRATDAEHMKLAYRNMLGEKGSQVAEMWAAKGVKRVHFDWAAEAGQFTGEERAQTIIDWENAPRRQIDPSEIDGPRTSKPARSVSEFVDALLSKPGGEG